MRAVIKRAEVWREQNGKQCKKKRVYNTKHCPIKPTVNSPHQNIGTGTVDYWLWMMDQELRAAFGQYIEG